MKLRVGSFHSLVYNGTYYQGGDEFEVPDENAAQWRDTRMVLPAEGQWPEDVHSEPEPPKARRKTRGRPPSKATCPCPTPERKNGGAFAVCSVPGCPCPVVSGKCRAHSRTSSNTGDKYVSWHDVDSRTLIRWRKLSQRIRRERPLCESDECAALPEPLRPASRHVDHIDDRGLKGPKAFEPDNLQALCVACHSRKTASERFGRD
jgi:5-methylcytosine-specific restriction protein A